MVASKCLRLGDAISVLVERGFYGEAFGLSRSSVEAYLVAKFISNRDKNPEKRAQSYLGFVRAHYFNLEQLRQKYSPAENEPGPEVERLINDALKAYPKLTMWESPHNMAKEILSGDQDRVSSTGTAYSASMDYDGIYEHSSHYVHACALSLTSHNAIPGGVFRTADRDSEVDIGKRAVYWALSYAFLTCILLGAWFNVDLPRASAATVEQTLKQGLHALGIKPSR
jgi:Family of unknown function (DUF5677)